MQAPLPVEYKGAASSVIYRDGGSLELNFIATDDKNYCIFMEVVNESPSDCKRYVPPILFKGSFDINSDDNNFVSYLTWQHITVFLEAIKADIGQDFEKFSCFDVIEKLANDNGWLIELP
ncbi:hypothetical protein [Psychrobacter sp. BF1]|uniref:hypothetical protein n=1 Tax=Psychrobacter sp. BF1 TaxID=2821147 RepID=UPI001C4DDBA0|nr:hypothetical protein [Psychrobacter sp. BF1]